MDLVAEESGGAVSVSFTGPDAVPTFEQFEPVQAGVFDLLFTHPAYHAGTTSVGLAIDAIGADPTKRRAGRIIDYIDEHYQTLGMKLIAAPATGSKGFRYFLKEPIAGEPGLEGRKIRGTVSYHPMIEALGGTGVVIGGGEVYSALQTGVVDGAAWGLTGAKDFKWYEVADYMADPVFGQVGVMIFMNLDAWNDLADDEKAAMERAATRLEQESIARFNKLAATEKQSLLDLGMKMTSFSDAEAAQFESLWSNGVWSIAAQSKPEEAAALRALAKEAGLSD
ncbi:TRAP transporter substrate-binding protein DctP [uncultured Hoeflea sp.]|uniref:TRAP transporter substrate-binding protein DctP n=1 Tax=uncultured Hoeflea sp. TaxID=538666 RepID=UPI00260784EC|nr:TRAP transporter substrate-binding protein DctP [uncultured Hoeflea sp.]